jgi:NADPH:quinone reductase-like Zn-dependent oxidoreductase
VRGRGKPHESGLHRPDVAAASVNGADWRVRADQYSQATFPLVLGRDFSGAVAALGAGVDGLKIGDAVFGVLEVGREGAYAEKLAVRRRAVRQQSSPNAARPSRAWRAHLVIAWSG